MAMAIVAIGQHSKEYFPKGKLTITKAQTYLWSNR